MRSNLMSEFMGLVRGQYDAKADGFLPGALCCAVLCCAVLCCGVPCLAYHAVQPALMSQEPGLHSHQQTAPACTCAWQCTATPRF